MGLAADPGFEFGDLGAQLVLVGGGDPQLQGGAEEGAGVEVDQGLDDRRARGGARVEELAQRGGAFLGDVGDGGGEEVLAGREVVLGGPARDAGAFGDDGDGGAGPALFGEAGDGRLRGGGGG
ncbi:hypothetical protein GCM10020254_47970 [Streptomyces goshikiensis]